MIRYLLKGLGLSLALSAATTTVNAQDRLDGEADWSIAIHGGAGTIERDRITPEKDAEIRTALNAALTIGSDILKNGGTAMDAVTASIISLENNPNFNAGKGAVFTWDRTNELDSSIMDGSDLSAGAVAGINGTKNPILLARAVKDNSPHVMLSGEGANQFSREQGLEQVPPDYYATPYRLKQIDDLRAQKVSAADVDYKFGTVGAVAMDRQGHMAAGTSTGGMTGKRWGRIGDSPIIGAGTYADDRSCAISATGSGEYFIRLGVAHEICTRIRMRFPEALKEAQRAVPKDADGNDTYIVHASEFMFSDSEIQQIADDVIAELGELGGDGGIIYATPWGQAGYSFNTAGMYRGRATSEAEPSVAIYGDEE
ncbi:isoaspartyl peptidase/L-asparaginase [Sphingorhabdus sp. YGSMI21]|uniref:isoaspartyl peptidase/L-asparaginase family protein n=1 Tax=Sphingorhabdus sp. YGSMI21 TaxID=2077182 RepID=UPI000C1E738B|nr:isoaspartyl peptidase/L-asparaginase [Sphingorhabdus sp. YGSMI21]ATW02549.1 isoaspartyl peptidase/L-asparaginase [Sphingorhabdus sp. YGSMI21]